MTVRTTMMDEPLGERFIQLILSENDLVKLEFDSIVHAA
ncbi:hypothetical protein JOE66_000359 [Subtercola frigoramans]|uniref:Uncharacterized protein n=1 Tax=Subtercola frigoramans TaxID=120298 RepID=A0ABS2L0X1_9MICO|nr:hypothetical protein [Subtercola frigoramans]